MAKRISHGLAKRDDPIFKSGLTVFTPKSRKGSTPSTPSSPSATASPAEPESPKRQGVKERPRNGG